MIIGGLQNIIFTCLDIRADSLFTNEDEEEDEFSQTEKLKKAEQNKNNGMFSSFFGSGENTGGIFNNDPFNETKVQIHKMLEQVFVSCMYCWNHMPMFQFNNYQFTRNGIFAYTQEDNKRINDFYKRTREEMKQQGQQDGSLNFEKVLQYNMNGI